MKVLDLFSGLKGFSKAFKDRGHEVLTVDIEKKFKPDIVIDVNLLEFKNYEPDIILASPPCNCFSAKTIWRYWEKIGGRSYPKDHKTTAAITLVKNTLELIHDLYPRWWILENPRGMLRTLDFMFLYERRTVTYCQYGKKYMKPTDLWGVFPKGFRARSCRAGDPCHKRTRRDSKDWSTDGSIDRGTSATRAMVPYFLSLDLCLKCELASQNKILVFKKPKNFETGILGDYLNP